MHLTKGKKRNNKKRKINKTHKRMRGGIPFDKRKYQTITTSNYMAFPSFTEVNLSDNTYYPEISRDDHTIIDSFDINQKILLPNDNQNSSWNHITNNWKRIDSAFAEMIVNKNDINKVPDNKFKIQPTKKEKKIFRVSHK